MAAKGAEREETITSSLVSGNGQHALSGKEPLNPNVLRINEKLFFFKKRKETFLKIFIEISNKSISMSYKSQIVREK